MADVVGLTVAFLLSYAVFGSEGGSTNAATEGFEYLLFFVAVVLPTWMVLATTHGLYQYDAERADHSTIDEFLVIVQAVALGTWIVSIGTAIVDVVELESVKILFFSVVAIATLTLARAGSRAMGRRKATYTQRAVLVGTGDVGLSIARKILQHPEYAIDLVGRVGADPKQRLGRPDDLPALGPLDRLGEIVSVYDIDRVIVAFSNEPDHRILDALRRLNGFDVQIDIVPRMFELIGPAARLHTFETLPLIAVRPRAPSRVAMAMKRALDVVTALVLLALTAPFFAYAALRVKRESPGPIFFRQARLGMGMKQFTLLKFRTMKADADDGEHRDYIRSTMESRSAPSTSGLYKLDRANVVTPFGWWLRRTSLDELPQLINVLRGDMSLVGPRPCLRYETRHFEPHHFERFLVPAGMTGLWQTTARARASFREALDMDVTYARNWSFKLDLMLLFRTPVQLIRLRATA